MTDPVDTNALRDAGKRADYFMTGDGPLWRAAADEVDWLRAELHEHEQGVLDSVREFNESVRFIREVRAENDRLRAVIENAPHEPLCRWDRTDALAYRGQTGNCTCWKADAL